MAIPRQLQIKTGVVKRLFKEYQGYQKEQQRQQERIDKLVASQADEHDIRKQHEVLQETVVMLPDCRQRLEKAFMELSQLMARMQLWV